MKMLVTIWDVHIMDMGWAVGGSSSWSQRLERIALVIHNLVHSVQQCKMNNTLLAFKRYKLWQRMIVSHGWMMSYWLLKHSSFIEVLLIPLPNSATQSKKIVLHPKSPIHLHAIYTVKFTIISVMKKLIVRSLRTLSKELALWSGCLFLQRTCPASSWRIDSVHK